MTVRSRRTRNTTKIAQQTPTSELSTRSNPVGARNMLNPHAHTTLLKGETVNATQSDVSIPANKKTKTSGMETHAEVADAKLCMFKDMPLDILYEIFRLLQPADLVSLCDASAIFWRTLCRKSVNYIWSRSREASGVYEIPDGVNEYYWAKLLFSARCMECNASDVFRADFNLRRRICDACKETKFINSDRFKEQFGADTTVLACVPSTRYIWGWDRAYWKDDVVQQLKTLSALKQDVNCGREGALNALERYKATRCKLIRFMCADASFFDQWQKARASIFGLQRYEEVTKRFVELGYNSEDFPVQMRAHKLVNQPVMFTEKCWKGIQEEFEPAIRATFEARASERRNALIFARRKLLDKAYAAHKLCKVPPSLWRSLPQVQSLLKMQPFNDLIECANNRELTEEDFTPLMENLEKLVDLAHEGTKIRLREQVLAAKTSFFPKRVSSTNEFKSLQLATLVFSCQRCKFFYFGWADIRSHYCGDKGLGQSTEQYNSMNNLGRWEVITTLEDLHGDFPHAFEYCAEGVAAVSLIVKVLGLNPMETTTSHLDSINPRFLCGGHKERDCQPHTAFNWRSFVSHLLACHRQKIEKSKMPQPSLMTAKSDRPSLQDVKQRETDIALEHGQWACAHCTKNLMAGCFEDIEAVRRHVHATHKVAPIQEGVDLIDMSGYRLRRALANGVYIDYATKWYGNGY